MNFGKTWPSVLHLLIVKIRESWPQPAAPCHVLTARPPWTDCGGWVWRRWRCDAAMYRPDSTRTCSGQKSRSERGNPRSDLGMAKCVLTSGSSANRKRKKAHILRDISFFLPGSIVVISFNNSKIFQANIFSLLSSPCHKTEWDGVPQLHFGRRRFPRQLHHPIRQNCRNFWTNDVILNPLESRISQSCASYSIVSLISLFLNVWACQSSEGQVWKRRAHLIN